MRLVIFTEPQLGASYADQLRVARHAEELGFEGFFRSDHYLTMDNADGVPGPTDSWVTLGALAARYADEFNVPFGSLEATREMFQRVTDACEAIDRKELPAYSAAQTVAVGHTDADAKMRAEKIGKTPPLFGTPGQVVDQIGRFAELGVTRLFLQVLDLSDLDHLDVIATEVAPHLP
jgi:alkanesulfonate monooxygenase SsuD/methylene tetrahydromethanopterin reductase-like flavin-dependent oxidoreductase (luciferase family)